MNLDSRIVIVPFSPDLKEAIKNLNLEWLEKKFKVEPQDELMLSNPQGEIIDKGGMIFYAKYDGKIVGTASLLKIDETTFELSKMAVTDAVQGLGIGNQLMEHCIKIAREKKIKKLVLYTNRKLSPALNLYIKYGFQEVGMAESLYERADVKMELTL
ncbi:GNAT family N-acetyltransferase [Flavobacterium limnophilum]|uniref:GNAT family N-acetyltransferase n=1 Tax=Flavobacterium limnophilum TaxID=3003262 RepID=UPI0022AC37A7|nr:GNAT family N-acetyltransferase [Flavobacterium limnophilum]